MPEISFDRPVFIVGCTNSGTKCLFYSLMEHQEFGGITKELHFTGIQPNVEGRLNRLFALYPCFGTNYANKIGFNPHSYDYYSKEEIVRHFEILAQYKPNFIEGNRWLVKDPKLSLRIRWLKEAFPDCLILSIVRNPWSVVEGIKRKLAVHGDFPMFMDTPTACAQWNITNNIILQDSIGNDDVKYIRYEDMIKAKTFPDKSTGFWEEVLEFLQVKKGKFTIPNRARYSNFTQDKDNKSSSNLTQWDIDYISLASKSLIERFDYKPPIKG